ncbi:MAG TPA: SufD family Fe-S cluster assembly protein, partial [Candidatus Dormibacteraeota bacterium]|nr:SufD family Fe-S cluster assembly protein [Candidatus Dormibacteraeota bacterium]
MGLDIRAVEEIASLHNEPDWLRARRRNAFELFENFDLPSRTEEEWRRTDLKKLDLSRFAAMESANGAPTADPIGDVAGVLRQRGSEPGKVELDPDLAAGGVIFCPLSQAAREHPNLIERHLFALTTADRDKFTALHAAFFSGGTFVYIPDGLVVEKPLVSQYWSSVGGALVLPHTLILAGEGSQVTCLDEFLSPDLDLPAYCSGSAEIYAGRGANVSYMSLQRWGKHAWQFADQKIHIGQEATVRLVHIGLGSNFSKNRVEARLAGPGGSAELKALFFGADDQTFDFHTLQDHRCGNTTSDLL